MSGRERGGRGGRGLAAPTANDARGRGRGRGNNSNGHGTGLGRANGSRGRGTTVARASSNPRSGGGGPTSAFRGRGAGLESPQPSSGADKPARAGRAPSGTVDLNQYYLTLKKNREKERAHAIANNLVDDPNKQRRLEDAITFIGTCQDMCPEFERVERIVRRAVDGCEKVVGADGVDVVSQERMVKRFRRSAAGDEAQLPSDVRPPVVLKKTLHYLIDEMVGGPQPLPKVHAFVWDRTRSIRNDFTLQNIRGFKNDDLMLAIYCYELIARFHIHSLHRFAHPEIDDQGFTAHNEREQLNKTLLSLMEFYDLCASRGIDSKNEAEFRAYMILMHLYDQDVEREAMNLGRKRPAIFQHPRLQTALELYAAAGNTHDPHGPLRPPSTVRIAQNNFAKFFRIVGSSRVSYTMACMAEIHFHHVRKNALLALRAGFRSRATMEDCTLRYLVEALGFDDEAEAQAFCEACGMQVATGNDGAAYLVLNSGPGQLADPSASLKQPFSVALVEHKRHGRTLPQVIHGLTARQAREAAGNDTHAPPAKKPPTVKNPFATPSSTSAFAGSALRASASPFVPSGPFASAFSNNLGSFGKPSGTLIPTGQESSPPAGDVQDGSVTAEKQPLRSCFKSATVAAVSSFQNPFSSAPSTKKNVQFKEKSLFVTGESDDEEDVEPVGPALKPLPSIPSISSTPNGQPGQSSTPSFAPFSATSTYQPGPSATPGTTTLFSNSASPSAFPKAQSSPASAFGLPTPQGPAASSLFKLAPSTASNSDDVLKAPTTTPVEPRRSFSSLLAMSQPSPPSLKAPNVTTASPFTFPLTNSTASSAAEPAVSRTQASLGLPTSTPKPPSQQEPSAPSPLATAPNNPTLLPTVTPPLQQVSPASSPSAFSPQTSALMPAATLTSQQVPPAASLSAIPPQNPTSSAAGKTESSLPLPSAASEAPPPPLITESFPPQASNSNHINIPSTAGTEHHAPHGPGIDTAKHGDIRGTPSTSTPPGSPGASAPPPPAAADIPEDIVTWLLSGDGGLLDQLADFMLPDIVQSAQDEYHAEQAQAFRQRKLMARYARRWRLVVERRSMIAFGRKSIQNMRQYLMEQEEKKKEREREREREDGMGLQSLLGSVRGKRRSLDSQSLSRPRSIGHKRSATQSDTSSIMPIPKKSTSSTRSSQLASSSPRHSPTAKSVSFLSGNSVIASPLARAATNGMIAKYGVTDTTRSDLWRLKAAGLVTLPNGITQPINMTPSSSSSSSSSSKRRKRSLDHDDDSDGGEGHVSARPLKRTTRTLAADGQTASLQRAPAARNLGPLTTLARPAPATREAEAEEEQEEPLSVRIQRIKDAMDEGIQFYRQEIEKEEQRQRGGLLFARPAATEDDHHHRHGRGRRSDGGGGGGHGGEDVRFLRSTTSGSLLKRLATTSSSVS